MSLRVLQFGTTGQVARELIRHAAVDDVQVTALSRADCDFAGDPDAAARLVAQHNPDLVIVAAAYTAVDQAEADRETAFRVNAETPGAIARACAASGAAMVWFSTDYVFEGDKGAYVETDTTSPPNVYGASKLAGEQAVLSACPRSLVLRTSWVVSAHGKNFVKTMLRLAGEGSPLKVVDDQFGRPTAAGDLARFVLSQAQRLAKAPAGDPAFGLFHFANGGEVSWKAFAEGVFDLALGARAPSVGSVTTAERPSPARRPLRGTLDTGKLERTFGVTPRPWREAAAEIVAELQAEKVSA